ncbi:MAG: hypothetical protein D6785_16365 [Planctomycetota bacterium]|nr:MAG: hypothetical protein D6785_16365 [Planctomycetota bacterium]
MKLKTFEVTIQFYHTNHQVYFSCQEFKAKNTREIFESLTRNYGPCRGKLNNTYYVFYKDGMEILAAIRPN